MVMIMRENDTPCSTKQRGCKAVYTRIRLFQKLLSAKGLYILWFKHEESMNAFSNADSVAVECGVVAPLPFSLPAIPFPHHPPISPPSPP